MGNGPRRQSKQTHSGLGQGKDGGPATVPRRDHTHAHASLAPQRRGRRGMTLPADCFGQVRTALFDLVRLGEGSIAQCSLEL